jgi:hypothetical protein
MLLGLRLLFLDSEVESELPKLPLDLEGVECRLDGLEAEFGNAMVDILRRAGA